MWACGPRLEGTESLRLPVHAGNVTALAFLHTDPQLLVTGGDDHWPGTFAQAINASVHLEQRKVRVLNTSQMDLLQIGEMKHATSTHQTESVFRHTFYQFSFSINYINFINFCLKSPCTGVS